MTAKLEEFERRRAAAIRLNRPADVEKYSALIIINEELNGAGFLEGVDADDINLTASGIYESPLGSRAISDRLTRCTFPSIPEKLVSHYTSLDTLRSIAKTRELRLYSVSKRLSESELKRFLEELGFAGHLDKDPDSGEPILEELSKHLFYTSFSEERDSNHFWYHFGDNYQGVRLDFHIRSVVEDFRSISYSTLRRSPIKSITERLRNELGRKFLLRGASKFCAFHLPCKLESEREDRLLLSDRTDAYSLTLRVQTDPAGNSYIALPIDGINSDYYTVTLKGIKAGTACSMTEFDEIVKDPTLASLVTT